MIGGFATSLNTEDHSLWSELCIGDGCNLHITANLRNKESNDLFLSNTRQSVLGCPLVLTHAVGMENFAVVLLCYYAIIKKIE